MAPADGFTLLELLVVLVLMLAITSIVLPQFSKSLSIFELQKGARETAAVLNVARHTAITEGREVIFALEPQSRSYTSTATNLRYPWPDGIEIRFQSKDVRVATDLTRRIVFNPDGSSSGARLTIATANKSYFIGIDWVTGQVRVYQ